MWRKEMKKSRKNCLLAAVLIILVSTLFQTLPASGCLQRDKKPPKIHWVHRYPQQPEYEDSVLVLAYVTDSGSGVANVSLRYIVNGQTAKTLVMDKKNGVYFAEIPPLPYNSTVAYVVSACDKAGNRACSSEYAYTVGDSHPPIITYVQRVPAKPNYNDTVIITANATEPPYASGVKELTLSYNCGSCWKNVSMELTGTLYTAAIPEQPFGTTVQYRICAVDRAGNVAAFDIYTYTVEDQYLPVATIITPRDGSFLSRSVDIKLYAHDDNLKEARLAIDGTFLALWNQTGIQTYTLNTSTLGEGIHKLTLEVVDEAGNRAENLVYVVVDNTAPIAEIQWPMDGSFVSGFVPVKLRAEDANFECMELRIRDSIYAWNVKYQIFTWNTSSLSDGPCQVTLTAFDKAGNKAERSITVVVDNTAPTIGNLTWMPLQPTANETAKVYAQIADMGSGVKEATLWYRRLDEEEWQRTSMALENGNWTATIQGFEEGAIVLFYVECCDKTGNTATSTIKHYVVGASAAAKGFTGIPLYWLALAVLAIFAILASTAYYLRKRKRAAPLTSTFLVSSL